MKSDINVLLLTIQQNLTYVMMSYNNVPSKTANNIALVDS